jgi:hypothetical protein
MSSHHQREQAVSVLWYVPSVPEPTGMPAAINRQQFNEQHLIFEEKKNEQGNLPVETQ